MDVKNKSIKELREICQREEYHKKRMYWRLYLLNRVSIYLTKLFLYTPITANQISILMIITGLIAVIFFMYGTYVYILLGLLFMLIYRLLDAVDGEVARCKKICSIRGTYLDYLSHVIVEPLIIIGLSIGVYRNNPTQIPSFIFLIFGFAGAYFFMLNKHMQKFEKSLNKKEVKFEKRTGIKKEIYNFFVIHEFNYIFLFGILNLLHYAVLIYGTLISLIVLYRIYSKYKVLGKR